MCAVLHRKAVRRRRRWRTHRRIRRETARVHRPGDPPAPTAGCPVGRHILGVRQNFWARQSRDQPAMAELSGLAGHRTESSSSAAMAPHRSDAGLSPPGGTSQNCAPPHGDVGGRGHVSVAAATDPALIARCPRLSGRGNRFVQWRRDWAYTILRTTLQIVRKPADQRGFVVIPPLGRDQRRTFTTAS